MFFFYIIILIQCFKIASYDFFVTLNVPAQAFVIFSHGHLNWDYFF